MRLANQLEPFTREGIRQTYRDSARWFADLDFIVGDLLDQWRLEPIGLMHGGRHACVLAVKRREQPMVLKITPSADQLEQELKGLRAFAACGVAPQVLRYDPERAAVLMERFIPGQNLREGGHFPNEDERIAELLWQLRTTTVGVPAQTRSVVEHLLPRLQSPLRRTGRAPAPVIDPARRQAAVDLLHELAGSGPNRLLHGNLHPANVVLHGGRLVTVDPLPLVGDPAYDVAEIALKRGCERVGSRHDPKLAAPTAAALAAAVGDDPERVRAWMEIQYCAGA